MGLLARLIQPLPPAWRRREPEKTALYRTLLEHLPAFLADTEVPAHVARILKRFLDCGILAKGFVRVRCVDCGDESLVAFSCKDRSFCPSCTARRSADTAAHLADAVLPHVPLRQYVLAFPQDLHHRLARNAELETQALAIFLEELTKHLRVTSGAPKGDPGLVTFIQHFGSTLNLHVHFHVLALDGVYARTSEGALRFWPAREPTQADIESLVERTAERVRKLTGRTAPEDEPTLIAPVLSVFGAVPLDFTPTKHLTATSDGFNLHGATHFRAADREGIEHFCRYAARGPLAMSRLSMAPNGNLHYRLKTPRADGTTQVVFTPHSFLVRLSWLVVQPRMHLTRYHGVLAPNHPWRNQIVPKPPVRLPNQLRCKQNRYDWATMLKRVFATEVLLCVVCGGTRRVIGDIREGPVARKILAHLGLPTSAPKPAQGGLFPTGPPEANEPEPLVDYDLDQRLPDDLIPS